MCCHSRARSQSPSHRGSLSHGTQDNLGIDPNRCLNPLRIGEVFRTLATGYRSKYGAASQSPSHRGSLSHGKSDARTLVGMKDDGLNPLRIGEVFRTACPRKPVQLSGSVSIPFASGKSFALQLPHLSRATVHRLNPLRIGEVFRTMR